MFSPTHLATIDWTGAKTPLYHCGIAVATASLLGIEGPLISLDLEGGSQSWSRKEVFRWLETKAKNSEEQRWLVGIDANLGWPAWSLQQLYGENAHVQTFWGDLDALCNEESNLSVSSAAISSLLGPYLWRTGEKPPWFSKETAFRQTDRACQAKAFGNPESPLKLIGPKQVGKAGLSAMRLVWQLKQKLGLNVCIWPFEKISSETTLVITEVFPRLGWQQVGLGKQQKVRSRLVLENLLARYEQTTLNRSQTLISEAIPEYLNDHQSDALIALWQLQKDWAIHSEKLLGISALCTEALTLEGWILGV
jgi:Protein of unknown function (DUF429)